MRVSVLVPAYNVENYISQCLESICNQTYRDLEIVVIDDGSKDSTFATVTRFAETDDRIIAITRENKGVAATRNELLDRATGDFVLFVDSDDWIEPDMISVLAEITGDYSVDIAMCRIHKGDSAGNDSKTEVNIWTKATVLNKFLEHRELTGSLWNKLIRKKLFDGLRFRPGIGYGEDAMVIWDILNRISGMASINRGLYHYRLNITGITHQGLSESKMSVIQVWDYISDSDCAAANNLTGRAKSRYGAELTLLLLGSVGDANNETYRNRVKILLKKLRGLYIYMIKDNCLSYKYKIFALLALVNWPTLKFIVNRTNLHNAV